MALTAEALRHYGVRLSPKDMEDLLLRTLEEMTRASTLPDPRRELTAEEVKALESGGFDLLPIERDGVDDPITRTAVLYAALRADSLSVQEAASLLKVNESRVRQLLGSRALYGFKDGHVWRIPRFQFEEDHILPGLDQVMPFLSASLHPVEVYTWFTTPDPDLESDNGEAPLSPYDWLRGGRSPAPVASVAADLGRDI
jgi:excisionase family DNA binding protein